LDLADPPKSLLLAHQIGLFESLSFAIAGTTITFSNAMEGFLYMFAASGPSKFLALLTNHA
jgi:hypothetical protein